MILDDCPHSNIMDIGLDKCPICEKQKDEETLRRKQSGL